MVTESDKHEREIAYTNYYDKKALAVNEALGRSVL
jgi:hypothetical protein